MGREYKIAYLTRHMGNGSTRIWKDVPEGLQNVWVRKKKADETGMKITLGYTTLVDEVLTSHTKNVSSGIKNVRKIRLLTTVE